MDMSSLAVRALLQLNAIETVAGNGTSGNSDGEATKGGFGAVESIAVGPDGSIYIADQTHHKIRRIKDGNLTTIAGSGIKGLTDGPALEAKLYFPNGLAVSRDSTIYITEGSNRVRKLKDGVLTTIAGSDGLNVGAVDGPALQSKFNGLMGVALDPRDESTLYVTEYSSHRIRVIRDGIVSTLAGCGIAQWRDGSTTTALLNGPHSIAVGLDGAVYFSDFGNHRIRMVKDGYVRTIAGSGVAGFLDGPADKAQFKFPRGVLVDTANNIIVADMMNHRIRIIKDGVVSTLAGAGTAMCVDGPISKAFLHSPGSLALDRDGTIYVPDFVNIRIRAIYNSGFKPVLAPPEPGISLVKSIDAECDGILTINGRNINIHQALFTARCPMIISSSARLLPIEELSALHFRYYIYSDLLPSGLHARALYGLSFLFKSADMRLQSQACLTQLNDLKLGDPALPLVDDLVSLYCHSLELSPFEEGSKIVRKLLQQNRSSLSPLMKRLPHLLGKFEDHLLDLMALVVIDDPPIDAISTSTDTSNTALSLETSLQKLFYSRDKDGNFEISIGDFPPQKAHSFVLYSTWPYFQHMIDAGMRESSQRRLTLPPPDEDGGLSPETLSLILEVAYTKKFDQEKLTDELALSLLSVAGLYLHGHEMQNSTENIFRKLLLVAEKKVLLSINLKTCIDVYKAAAELHISSVEQKAREMIISNFHGLIQDATAEKKMKSLPTDLQCQILWKVIGK